MIKIKSTLNKTKGLLPKKISSKLPREIGVVLLKAGESAKLNMIYRNKKKASNMLSFYYSPEYGEILICPEIVKKEAKEQGNLPPHLEKAYKVFLNKTKTKNRQATYKKGYTKCGGEQVFQMTWMIVHGMIHLAGVHHENSQGMESKFIQLEKILLAKTFGP